MTWFAGFVFVWSSFRDHLEKFNATREKMIVDIVTNFIKVGDFYLRAFSTAFLGVGYICRMLIAIYYSVQQTNEQESGPQQVNIPATMRERCLKEYYSNPDNPAM